MKNSILLLLLAFSTISYWGNSQNLQVYFSELNTSEDRDKVFNAKIDSFWEATLKLDGDTSGESSNERQKYITELYNYF